MTKKAKMVTPSLTVHNQRARRLLFKRVYSLHRQCQRPCAYGCAKLQGSSISRHSKRRGVFSLFSSERSFQPLHTTKAAFSQCMLRQDTLTVLQVQYILRSDVSGLSAHHVATSPSQLKSN